MSANEIASLASLIGGPANVLMAMWLDRHGHPKQAMFTLCVGVLCFITWACRVSR